MAAGIEMVESEDLGEGRDHTPLFISRKKM